MKMNRFPTMKISLLRAQSADELSKQKIAVAAGCVRKGS